MGAIRNWINDPARAAVAGPTHQEVWNRENERFDKEASFITAQNAESRNHEFRMAQQAHENQLDTGTQQFGFQYRLNAQQHGFNMATMQHMDNTGSVGEFHPSGMPSRYVPKSSGFSSDSEGPEPMAESRNGSAQQGVSDVAGPSTPPPAGFSSSSTPSSTGPRRAQSGPNAPRRASTNPSSFSSAGKIGDLP